MDSQWLVTLILFPMIILLIMAYMMGQYSVKHKTEFTVSVVPREKIEGAISDAVLVKVSYGHYLTNSAIESIAAQAADKLYQLTLSGGDNR